MSETESISSDSISVSYSINECCEDKKRGRFVRMVFPCGFKEEFIEVFKLSWPSILTSFLQLFLQTVSIIMCGQLQEAQLDAAGLANSMINVFGIAIGMGISTACDTFFSQAFGGEEKWRVGVYLQRSMVIMNCIAVLICCLYINMLPIVTLISENVEIAKLTADYMLYFFPGIFFQFNFLIMSRYLQNQSIVYPSLICSAIGNVVNIVGQYVSIQVLGFSYLASAVCQAVSLGVMMVTQLIYILVSKVYKDTWDGFSINESLRGWGMFFALGIPGLFMVCLEEWSFEIATFISDTMDPVQLGIQTIVFQVEAVMYMVPLGVSIAVNIRVGQHLGGGRPEHAKTAHRVGLALIFIVASVLAILLVSLKDFIPFLFTNDEPTAQGASSVLILVAGFVYFDGISATSAGALRGCGRQLIGAIILFIGYYVIALPIGISLALATELQVYGLWCGLLVGIGIEAIIFIFVVGRTNWEYYCEQAELVAYGGEGKQTEYALDSLCCCRSMTSDEMISETDPLLGPRRQQCRYSSNIQESDLSSSESSEEINGVSEEPFRYVLIKRAIFAVFIVFCVAAAVIVKIFEQTPCYPVNNSTMSEYAGILPLCNETIVTTD